MITLLSPMMSGKPMTARQSGLGTRIQPSARGPRSLGVEKRLRPRIRTNLHSMFMALLMLSVCTATTTTAEDLVGDYDGSEKKAFQDTHQANNNRNLRGGEKTWEDLLRNSKHNVTETAEDVAWAAPLNITSYEEDETLAISDASKYRAQKEPCVLFKNDVLMEDGTDVESVQCFEPSTRHVFEISGISQDELLSRFDSSNYEGLRERGAPTLMQEGAFYDEESATLVLDPELEMIQYGIYEGDSLHESRRKLAVTGRKRVLVLRIVGRDSSTSGSEASLRSDWFTDTVNFKNQMEACSYNKFQVVDSGVATIRLNRNVRGSTNKSVELSARNAARSQIRNLSSYDYVAYCLPPGTAGRWIAYAYTFSSESFYNDVWCNHVSAQMHEIGHNLGLAHSNERGGEYEDKSGMMGYSYQEDTTRMCFNGAKSWQLGWYSDRHRTVTSGWTGKVYGVSDYRQAGSSDAVIVRVQGSSDDWYVTFNRKRSMNSQTKEGADQVLVHKRKRGRYESSDLAAKLSSGRTYNGAPLPIRVLEINLSSNYARIQVGTGGGGPTDTCGGGNRGNGRCSDSSMCCSMHGWCGTSPEHCSVPGEGTCGGGDRGNGICEDTSLCCSQWGWCGRSSEHCNGRRGLRASRKLLGEE